MVRPLIRGWFLLSALFVFLSPAAAKISFAGLDIAEDNRLLFRADSDSGGAHNQNALFISRLSDLSLRQLTAFPEEMDLIEDGRTIQIRNAFGALRLPVSGGLPRNIPGFPSFAGGTPALGGRVEGMSPSGDGKWLLYVEPVTAAYGRLVLINTESGARIRIADKVERPGTAFPACWSPDSRIFVYCREGSLYYHTVSGSVDERYRLIGEGSINSVRWGGTGDFFYLRGSTVYRVRSSELFIRALYADFLEIGAVAGKIPFEFDYNFDSFWVAPDSRSILLSKGGRNVFYYPLGTDDYQGDFQASLPYVMVSRACSALTVLWSPSGTVTVIASMPRDRGLMAYRLNVNSGGRGMVFVPLDVPAGPRGALSPDGTKALFWGEAGIALYDYNNWRILRTISVRPTYSCLWIGNEEFITGDRERIERVRIAGSQEPAAINGPVPGGSPAANGTAASKEPAVLKDLICISSVSAFGFEESGSRIFAQNGGLWFATDGQNPWREIGDPRVRPAVLVSGYYRVYLEKQNSGPYENLPMVRNTASVGTAPLFPVVEYPRPSQVRDENQAPGIFTHGRREGLREVALCFDLYDDATGLPGVLNALDRFGVRATFFLNGEFIRRHPSAAREILEAGHEAASLFFAPIDVSDARYRIDGDFIGRGLARNEDEFHRATGGELDLLWHAPYYAVSSEIAAAAGAAGYKTVGRDTDPMDWVSRDEAKRLGISQFSASDMIDLIMDTKRPGSIIPLRLGLLPGGRNDYLFNRVEVLLDALVRAGYSVVPVSVIMEHAR
jgi:peptidoglycan/xylan/chitin deacetylase (PgdA/CDA1 family)